MKYRTLNDKKKDLFSVSTNPMKSRKPIKFKKLENLSENLSENFYEIFSEKKMSNLFQFEYDSKIFNDKNININININKNSNSNSNNDYSNNILSYDIRSELYPLSLQGNNNLDYFVTNLNILQIFNLNFITSNFVQNYDLTLDDNLKKFYDHLETMKRISNI
jgi:hypothetical protein